MLTRSADIDDADAERRARKNRSLKECRARKKKELGLAPVEYDGAMLDMLVKHRYLTDAQAQTGDKALVGKAFSLMLRDVAHYVKNIEAGFTCPHCHRLLWRA